MNLLFCCKTCICNKRLCQNCTNFSISILGKTNHIIWACIEVFIMSLDTLKKEFRLSSEYRKSFSLMISFWVNDK